MIGGGKGFGQEHSRATRHLVQLWKLDASIPAVVSISDLASKLCPVNNHQMRH